MNDKCFCHLIEDEYKLSSFDVLGPRILLPKNKVCDFNDKKIFWNLVYSSYKSSF